MAEVIHFQKSGKYKQAVKGESNYQEHLERAAQEENLQVDLFLEDHNKFDKNAVAVVFETDTVGYLSREDAIKYRAAIRVLGHSQAIGTCAAKTTGGGEDRNYGLVLDLNLDNLQIENISLIKSQTPSTPIQPVKVKPTPTTSKKNSKRDGNIIAIILTIFFCCIIFNGARTALESAGIISTSIPEPTRTPYIAPIFLTLTAQPTNTPRSTYTPIPTKTLEEKAWSACILFIDQQLKLSIFDAQEYNPNGIIKAGNDYLVDVNYASNNVTYTCLLTQESNGDWILLELSKK